MSVVEVVVDVKEGEGEGKILWSVVDSKVRKNDCSRVLEKKERSEEVSVGVVREVSAASGARLCSRTPPAA